MLMELLYSQYIIRCNIYLSDHSGPSPTGNGIKIEKILFGIKFQQKEVNTLMIDSLIGNIFVRKDFTFQTYQDPRTNQSLHEATP